MRQGAGPLTWLASDHQGTAQIAVNSVTQEVVQRRQLPFGGPRGAAVAFPGERGFVGGTTDASTGLIHLGAREYDQETGRFVSVDPVLDLGDPQQLNGYTYSDNSPVTRSDPSGLLSCPDGDCRNGKSGSRAPTPPPPPAPKADVAPPANRSVPSRVPPRPVPLSRVDQQVWREEQQTIVNQSCGGTSSILMMRCAWARQQLLESAAELTGRSRENSLGIQAAASTTHTVNAANAAGTEVGKAVGDDIREAASGG